MTKITDFIQDKKEAQKVLDEIAKRSETIKEWKKLNSSNVLDIDINPIPTVVNAFKHYQSCRNEGYSIKASIEGATAGSLLQGGLDSAGKKLTVVGGSLITAGAVEVSTGVAILPGVGTIAVGSFGVATGVHAQNNAEDMGREAALIHARVSDNGGYLKVITDEIKGIFKRNDQPSMVELMSYNGMDPAQQSQTTISVYNDLANNINPKTGELRFWRQVSDPELAITTKDKERALNTLNEKIMKNDTNADIETWMRNQFSRTGHQPPLNVPDNYTQQLNNLNTMMNNIIINYRANGDSNQTTAIREKIATAWTQAYDKLLIKPVLYHQYREESQRDRIQTEFTSLAQDAPLPMRWLPSQAEITINSQVLHNTTQLNEQIMQTFFYEQLGQAQQDPDPQTYREQLQSFFSVISNNNTIESITISAKRLSLARELTGTEITTTEVIDITQDWPNATSCTQPHNQQLINEINQAIQNNPDLARNIASNQELKQDIAETLQYLKAMEERDRNQQYHQDISKAISGIKAAGVIFKSKSLSNIGAIAESSHGIYQGLTKLNILNNVRGLENIVGVLGGVGTIFSAAIGIVSLIRKTKNDDSQALLFQHFYEKIKQDLTEMKTEILDKLDAIDSKISKCFDAICQRLDTLGENLAMQLQTGEFRLIRRLDEIQNEIDNLSNNINQQFIELSSDSLGEHIARINDRMADEGSGDYEAQEYRNVSSSLARWIETKAWSNNLNGGSFYNKSWEINALNSSAFNPLASLRYFKCLETQSLNTNKAYANIELLLLAAYYYYQLRNYQNISDVDRNGEKLQTIVNKLLEARQDMQDLVNNPSLITNLANAYQTAAQTLFNKIKSFILAQYGKASILYVPEIFTDGNFGNAIDFEHIFDDQSVINTFFDNSANTPGVIEEAVRQYLRQDWSSQEATSTQGYNSLNQTEKVKMVIDGFSSEQLQTLKYLPMAAETGIYQLESSYSANYTRGYRKVIEDSGHHNLTCDDYRGQADYTLHFSRNIQGAPPQSIIDLQYQAKHNVVHDSSTGIGGHRHRAAHVNSMVDRGIQYQAEYTATQNNPSAFFMHNFNRSVLKEKGITINNETINQHKGILIEHIKQKRLEIYQLLVGNTEAINQVALTNTTRRLLEEINTSQEAVNRQYYRLHAYAKLIGCTTEIQTLGLLNQADIHELFTINDPTLVPMSRLDNFVSQPLAREINSCLTFQPIEAGTNRTIPAMEQIDIYVDKLRDLQLQLNGRVDNLPDNELVSERIESQVVLANSSRNDGLVLNAIREQQQINSRLMHGMQTMYLQNQRMQMLFMMSMQPNLSEQERMSLMINFQNLGTQNNTAIQLLDNAPQNSGLNSAGLFSARSMVSANDNVNIPGSNINQNI